MDKKKRNIIILIVALVLLIGSGTVCLVNVLGNRDNKASAKTEGTTEVEVADTEEKTTNTTTEKVTTEKATTEAPTEKATTESESGTSTKPKDTEEATTETVVTTTQSTQAPSTTQSTQATTSTPATTQAPTTTEKEKIWHPPVTEMVWVVDKEAWTEIIPIYEGQESMRCHGCQGKFYSGDSFWAHVDADREDNCGGGWSSHFEQVQVGTTEVYHEEEGHWEEVVVQEGYWE